MTAVTWISIQLTLDYKSGIKPGSLRIVTNSEQDIWHRKSSSHIAKYQLRCWLNWHSLGIPKKKSKRLRQNTGWTCRDWTPLLLLLLLLEGIASELMASQFSWLLDNKTRYFYKNLLLKINNNINNSNINNYLKNCCHCTKYVFHLAKISRDKRTSTKFLGTMKITNGNCLGTSTEKNVFHLPTFLFSPSFFERLFKSRL